MAQRGDLSDFEHGIVIAARQPVVSISESDGLLGFSHKTISKVYKEWSEKKENI